MSYATKSDLVNRFGELELVQLTDRTHRPPTTVDDAVVARALDDASGLVDGYLGKVAALPLAAVPPNLVKLTADIARYHLHGKAAEKDSAVTRAYQDAVKWLQDVSRGLVQLEVGGAPAAPVAGGPGRVTGSDPALTRDSLRSF